MSVQDRAWLNEVVELIDDAIRTAADDDAQDLGCVDVEWLAGPETLRVYIDKLGASEDAEDARIEQSMVHGGAHITVDDCAVVNKILFECPALDQKIDSPYNLEVSSLGLEPPLRLPRHFRCYLGESVKVKLSEPLTIVEGRSGKSLRGQLTAVSESDIAVAVDGGEPVSIPLAQIIKARAVYAYE